MILATQGDAGAWVRELKEFPEQILHVGQLRHTRDLFSSKELLKLYERDNPNSRLTSIGLGRKLAAAGFVQVLNGQPVKGPDGKHERFWAVRNIAHWKKTKDWKAVTKDLKKAPVKI